MKLLPIFFGGVVPLAAAYGLGALPFTGAPPEIALACGAAIESVLVFLIVSAGTAGWPAFLALSAAGLAAAIFAAVTRGRERGKWAIPYSRVGAAIFAVYGIFYLVNALAPEVWADGYTYHLAMPAEILRLGGFPARVRFYDLIPQGMEMLFTVAYAFGGGSAARLVEFGLYTAGVPLILRLGRRLEMSGPASLLVAVFYFTAPVFGLTGSSSYNDAALVFFTLATFWLLLEWRDTGQVRWLFAAGLAAGFCYAIKFPGSLTVFAAAIFVLAAGRRRIQALAVLGAGAAVCALPWIARAFMLTGNPFAPMMNGLFPNPYFSVGSERELAATMRSWNGIPAWRVPWELAFGGHMTGIFGPLIFLLPIGVLALRRRAGRWCLAAAAILTIAWILNTGARFFMPAATLAMFAAAMPLPRAAVWAAIAIQAVLCWPQALNLWCPAYVRLDEFPWRAALRMESEADYLRRRVPEYATAKMVERATPPDAHIFSLASVAEAYLDRDVLVRWHSSEAVRIFDALQMAFVGKNDWFFNWKGAWAPQPVRALRFRIPAANAMKLEFSEVRLENAGQILPRDSGWTLRAWPNIWGAPLAFDGLRTSMWSSEEPARPGMFLEVDLGKVETVSSVTLLSHTPLLDAPLEIFGLGADGRWRPLDLKPRAERRPTEDLRMDAITVMRRDGFGWLLVDTGPWALGPLSRALVDDAPEWGLRPVARTGHSVLLRVW